MTKEVIKELKAIGRSLKKLEYEGLEAGVQDSYAHTVGEQGEYILDLLGEGSEEGV